MAGALSQRLVEIATAKGRLAREQDRPDYPAIGIDAVLRECGTEYTDLFQEAWKQENDRMNRQQKGTP